jgi:ABC-type spermidine/putrescine transport system permease subunit I
VSFFRYQMLVGMVSQFTTGNYVELVTNPTTWALYLSTAKFTLIVLAITFVLGFWIAYFLVFHVRNLLIAIGLFLVCTVPFWTSNIIRMISWRPVLGKEGLINSGLIKAGVISHPLDWLLFSRLLGGGRLVGIGTNWYVDDLPPMLFMKKVPNSHGFVSPADIEHMWREQFDCSDAHCAARGR